MTATKPRWRLLTDATRRELKAGDVVCVRTYDGQEWSAPVACGPFTFSGEGVLMVAGVSGLVRLSSVHAVRIDPGAA